MPYYSNKSWTRVYKVKFNDADIFFDKVYRRDSNDNSIVDTIELDRDNSLVITEEQLPVVQKFGNGIKSMTYIGKLFGHKLIVNEKKEKET